MACCLRLTIHRTVLSASKLLPCDAIVSVCGWYSCQQKSVHSNNNTAADLLCSMQEAVRPVSIGRQACAPADVLLASESHAASCKILTEAGG